MADTRRVSFTFDGGMASGGELNFYEAGRFYYGAARLIYTIEKFRQNGIVIDRITENISADFRVRSAKPGSFWQDVIIAGAPIIAECALKVPFEALFAHIWSRFGLADRNETEILNLAQIELEREKLELERSKEETKRTEIMGRVMEQGFALAGDAIRAVTTLQQNPANAQHAMALVSAHENLEARQKTDEIVRPYRSELDKIDAQVERSLTSKLQGPIKDIGLPLRSSAVNLRVGFSANDNTCAYLTNDSVKWLTSETVDSQLSIIEVNIKNFDKETGRGRLRYNNLDRPLPFRLLDSQKRKFILEVIESMKKYNITMKGYFIRNRRNIVRSFIVDGICDKKF